MLYPPPAATFEGKAADPSAFVQLAQALADELHGKGSTPSAVTSPFPGTHTSAQVYPVVPGSGPSPDRRWLPLQIPLTSLSGAVDIVAQVKLRSTDGSPGQVKGALRDSAQASVGTYQSAFIVPPGSLVFYVVAQARESTGRTFGEEIDIVAQVISMRLPLVKIAILFCTIFWICGAQETKKEPEFEVASVKPAPPPVDFAVARGLRYFRSNDERFEATNETLAGLISFAYGMKYERISGPAWLDQAYFQVMAKLAPGSTKADTPAMLRKLLTNRFQLRVHHEQRPEAVYELGVDKHGPKLRSPKPGAPEGFYGWTGRVFCGGCTLAQLADYISGRVSARMRTEQQAGDFVEHTIDRPVVDETGLTGIYDIDLQWVPPGGLGNRIKFPDDKEPPRDPSVKADSIFGALEAGGLNLQAARHLFDYLVVDHAERIPSEN